MLKQHGIGTPPEKRLKVSDLVAQNLGQQMFKPSILGEGQSELLPHIIQPHQDGEGMEIAEADPKTVERFIIEIENEETIGGTQQVHIAPNQTILVAPAGVEHELTSQALGEIAISMPPGLEGGTVTAMTEVEEISSNQGAALEAIVTTAAECSEVDQFPNVQYAEVMIPSDQVSGLVQQVTFVPQ